MPGKSRRTRGQYSVQSKKKKGRSGHPAMPAQPPAVAQAHEPVSSSGISVPAASVPGPKTKPAAVHYPYIATELLTIGILAGIMLAILIVLAVVLS